MDNKISGLTDDEVLRSRKENGSNVLEAKSKASFFKKLIKNLGDPIIRILIAAFVITLLLSGKDGIPEALGIAASILISTLVSTVSEYGSEKAFQKMQKEARKQTCEVIRGGRSVTLSVEELVVGDAVYVRAGDKIGADGILIDGSLSCDMSAINGESAEVQKNGADAEIALGEPTDAYSLFRGALVSAGRGIMLVKAVGSDTYYGKIAGEMQSDNGESPLREKLSVLAGTLSKFGYFCAACVAVACIVNSVFFNDEFVFTARNLFTELLHALTLAVSVVVVAVPEGLPMMITVVLSSNMIRMQKQNIRVRKPVGIETAGNIDILFTDKTGTLTYGRPQVTSYTSGKGIRSCRSVDMTPLERFLLGLCAVFAGDSKIEGGAFSEKRRAVSGNATDRALLSEYIEGGNCIGGCNRISYLPFDSKIKLSAACVDISESFEFSRRLGDEITVIKGAPEILLKYCNSCYGCDGRREKLDKGEVLERIARMSEKGIRSIAAVTSKAPRQVIDKIAKRLASGELPDISELLCDACFLTLIEIKDEIRSEAPKSVASLKKAGIQVVMITGDARGTASAIAKETGILVSEYDAVIEGAELKNMSDKEIEEILPRLRVVARALPDDKSRLVRVAKKCGRITAMTGDGLNDAPALRAADVGFAMGSGTDVAREAGDIIINNNDVSSIERAVLYGRTIFRSIRSFVVFQLIMNLSAVGISIIGPFIGFEVPVTVPQMLWINLIMDTLAAVAFAGEAPLARYMDSPPIPKNEPVLNGDMLTRIFVMGIYTVMVCLFFNHSAYVSVLFGGRESMAFMSGFFALFVFCGVFGAFNARSGRVNILAGLFTNPVFITVISLVFCVQIGMIYSGSEMFRCVPLTPTQLKTVILLALTVIPAGISLEIVMKLTAPRKKARLIPVRK